MGNKLDPRCQSIYDEYQKCYQEWQTNTEWRQYYHEGNSNECNELLNEFQYCAKEQISRMTGYVPDGELMKIREQVKKRKAAEQQQSQQEQQPENVTVSTQGCDDT
mmetsp:Transcript_49413/g.82240  ORF Transcript_49413/g.82240 Transcript_49413/m.82240 type:complete len:106 (+) Transcript_49413:24-341(+)|eukprot:CAMPEP_0202700178 /NCGR_PEP_ID=MMETSP1385-20130828/13385_1 /ASSEMBLY_ACC=CAM_ASM_000861 /TAXON_ID=933848 /ORGANISM="Elphidium margaritaceum" /LENGTH=105 /DNA_ID=CAMNT_0049357309 /DNA_START=18 /DNA_END=335 /DNA_ORIENTATION=-